MTITDLLCQWCGGPIVRGNGRVIVAGCLDCGKSATGERVIATHRAEAGIDSDGRSRADIDAQIDDERDW